MILTLTLAVYAGCSDEPAVEVDYRPPPLVWAGGAIQTWTMKDDQKITGFVHVTEESGPTIFIVPGFSETFLKYEWVIQELVTAGYNVVALDHRGMGLSDRLAEDPQVIHVEEFDDYVEDLAWVLENKVAPVAGEEIFVLAHSTGGLMVLNYLQRKDAKSIAGLAMSAPLLKMNMGMPGWVGNLVAKILCFVGKEKSLVPGRGPFDPDQVVPSEVKTTRNETMIGLQVERWKKYPQTVSSGPSNRWLSTTYDATSEVEALTLDVPTIMFRAGDDHYVETDIQKSFCEASKQCRYLTYDGARHELLMEIDEVRKDVLKETLEHFRANRKRMR